MELAVVRTEVEPAELEAIINSELENCHLTQGLQARVWKTSVVFEDGNNWMSVIEPSKEISESYKASPEIKKMLLKLMGDIRLKYNLK
jgi:hypothetical protein